MPPAASRISPDLNGSCPPVFKSVTLPAAFQLVEAMNAVMAFQGRRVAVAQSVAEELGENARVLLLAQEFHHGDALGVERPDPPCFGIFVEMEQFRDAEELPLLEVAGQVLQVHVDAPAR